MSGGEVALLEHALASRLDLRPPERPIPADCRGESSGRRFPALTGDGFNAKGLSKLPIL